MSNEIIIDFLRQIGSKGGKQRKKNLSKKELRKIAKAGAKARWSKRKKGAKR
jgi:hypothetical protein